MKMDAIRRPMRGAERLASKPYHQQLLMAALVATLLVVLLVASPGRVEAKPSPSVLGLTDGRSQAAGINNLESLISDILDDAGNRLKKSKVNSVRQIKQTLRFGRRSDPLMSPAGLLEQLALENELENQQQQQQQQQQANY